MKITRKGFITIGIGAVVVITIVFAALYKSSPEGPIKIDPAFRAYITAFTSGVISCESNIRIQLTNEHPDASEGTLIDKDLFDFDPSVKGEAFWLDKRTIEYRPAERLPSGETFTVEFYIYKLFDNVPENLKTFRFQFQTIKQSFNVKIKNRKTYVNEDLRWSKIIGTLQTADIVDSARIEKVLTATQESKELNIRWTHQSGGTMHDFQVDSVWRKARASSVIIEWDGSPVDVDLKGADTVEVPSLSDFKIMKVEVVQQPEQYVLLQFSDPLQQDQDLQGLVTIQDCNDLRFVIEDNEIMAYPPVIMGGDKDLKIEAGVKNILGYNLKKPFTTVITFEEIKPAVRLIGNGVILPNSNGLIFPFQSVNLKAVDVKIIKIFENNVGQFMQVNQLDGSSQLKRVGRIIFNKTIQLNEDKLIDYGRWNTFSFNLSKLIETEPGAIYRIEIGFKKKYSLYPCDEEQVSDEDMEEIEEAEENWDEGEESENSYWDYYDEYSYDDYYYYEDYDWNERDNPCHESYYGKRRSVSRNVLASDLGIIAKGGSDRTMTFAVTDIRTTKPLSGVTLEIYNYQNQLISTTKTNSEGMAKVDVKNKPYLLIAKNGTQRGYLRLDDGSSLSLSTFDVSGNVVQKGIKGYIYGERGVWRPGDSLYIMFILEDKEMLLPKTHPISFELVNPLGQLVQRMVRSNSMNGFYNFSTMTDKDAPTGNWTVRIKVGGATFTKTIKIETIKPNRLKINLDFGVEKLSVDKSDIEGNLAVKWLHGAIAKNLKANIAVTLVQLPTNFKRYEEYTFDDPVRKFYSEEQVIFDDKIDKEGNAKVKAGISVNNTAPGMLMANFVCRVFEESGDFSIDRFSIPYSPYESFVGIKTPKGDKARGMLLTDTTHTVDIITVDADGKPIMRNNLEIKVYKVQWKWWWDVSDDDLASYVGSENNQPVQSKIISTNKSGKAKFKLRINYPEWGRYLIRVSDPVSGHCTGKAVYLDWPGWAGRAQKENPGGATILSFISDKKEYNVGEKATITIPSSNIARALVSIESGSKVIDAYWVETKKGQTVFDFKITEEMAPNVYVHVTLLQPHAQTVNDLPIRLYGVIPLMVEDPQTKLHPVIDMPKVLAPEENVTIKVKEKEGKKMTYTLAMVDEGLLDLTRFETPDPWSNFYAREALGVKTWDMYDMVMGAYGGKLEKIFSIGGDGEITDKGKKSANRFKPMIKFLGPFELNKGSVNSHTFKMPQYVGSVRTMVIAGYEGAYGSTDKTTPVRKPLMILATLPRVVGPGETVKLPVTVFAMEKKVKNVSLEVIPNNYFTVLDSKKKSIVFNRVGDKVVNFNLQVASKIGIGKVKVIARCGSEKAEYNIEIDVRNPNPKVVDYIDAVIEPGKTWESNYKLIGINGTNKGVLEVSYIPPIDFGRRLKYLIDYPHGCIEQTTSAAFPQLFLEDVMDVNNELKKKISENVKVAINRLKTFMLSSGGLGYWPNSAEPDEWGTSYAGHFILEAEAKGYTLPIGFKKNWINYQKKMAKKWSPNYSTDRYYYSGSDFIQAYRLYTLALAKNEELGAMNRLRESKNLSIQARWQLASAYVLAGQPEVAKKLTFNLGTDIKEYRELSYTYGSDDRDRAMILETMSLLGERSKAIPLMKSISSALCNTEWMSTQTTAYCLIALSKFAGKNTTSKELKFTYVINNGKSVKTSTKLPISQIDMKVKGTSDGKVNVTNNSSGIIYARITLEGIPETGDKTFAENNLKLNIVYKNMSGNIIDVTKLDQGTDFMAEVTITNPGILGDYKEMALTQIFPSGWEIYNTRLNGFESVYIADMPTYQDIRDDRVYTYFDIISRKTLTYRILLNAAYLGRFYLPTIYCEAMYDNKINARKPGKWVEVIIPGE